MKTLISILLLAITAQVSAADKAPQFIEPASLENSLTMFWGLLIVLAFIFVTLFILKKMGFTGYHLDGPIKVLHGVQVGQKEKIILVEVGDEQILVGVTPGELTKLHKLKKKVDIDLSKSQKSPPNFKNLITSMLDKNETTKH